jgi:hypothetical protein
MALGDPREDLPNRTPVWVAMSDLYLDTELTDAALAHIAKVCAASPYSERELEHIMFSEVWPAFIPNLLSVAGEWAGWREDVVQRKVLERYRSRIDLPWRLNPLKRFFCREWSTVAAQIARARRSTS